MINVRKSSARGHAQHGWLESYHTFSFASYHDPEQMGFRSLRVINEDRIQPGQGFATHSHRDMEILSYVIEGALAHKDSMGNGSTIHAGELQYMSAGSGVTHSEFNHSTDKIGHFLQIWIVPDQIGLQPRYGQLPISSDDKKGQLKLVASPSGASGSIAIRQDVNLFACSLESRQTLSYELKPQRHAWIQMVKGGLSINNVVLEAGDGARVSEERALSLAGLANGTEFLFFDLN